MAIDRYYEEDASKRIWRDRFHGSRSLIVFIHGLSGHLGDSYWGALPRLLNYHPAFSGDFMCWSYPASKRPPAPPLLELLLWNAPSIDISASRLIDELSALRSEMNYESVALFGHSLGGLVALRAAIDVSSVGVSLSGIGLASTPLFPHSLARLSPFKSAPMRHLASRCALSEARRVIDELGSSITYFRADRDPIVKWHARYEKALSRSRVMTLSGGHSWPRSIERPESFNFCTVAEWASSQVVV